MASKNVDSNNSGNDKLDKKIIDGVIKELRPLMDEAIEIKIKHYIDPISSQIADLKKTFTTELKNVTANVKPIGTVQPNGNFDVKGLLSSIQDDPAFKAIAPMLGLGGGTPGSIPQAITPPPNFSEMKPEDRQWYEKQQAMQLLPTLLQAIMPLIQPQNNGFLGELMMRKTMADMSFAEHANRAMMGFMMKTMMKDPQAFDSYIKSSDTYMSPIADPAKYAQIQQEAKKVE